MNRNQPIPENLEYYFDFPSNSGAPEKEASEFQGVRVTLDTFIDLITRCPFLSFDLNEKEKKLYVYHQHNI